MVKLKKDNPDKIEKNLSIYFHNISKIKPYNQKEESELAKRIKKGDENALKDLIEANLRFVVKVAKQYENQGLPLSDLISEGNLGLLYAVELFNGEKNYKFISYAVWWIRRQILQALADNSRVVRLPTHRVNQLFELRKKIERLEQKHARSILNEEILDEFEDEEKKYIDLLYNIDRGHVRLDSPIRENEDKTFLETILFNEMTIEDDLDKEALKKEMKDNLSKINKRDRNVLERYFGLGEYLPHTLNQLAELLNISRERVRQIKDRGLRSLRHVIKNKPGSIA